MSVKTALFAALAGMFSIFFALFKAKKAGIIQAKATYEEGAREAEHIGYEAGIDGVKKEPEELAKPIDTEKRDYFE